MNPQNTDKAEAAPNSFATMLAQLGRGDSLAELSAKVTELVAAVRHTGKKAKMTYTLVIEPVAGTDGTQVIVRDKLKPEKPEPDRKTSLFFTTEAGGLSRRDPQQRDWIDDAQANGGAAVTLAGGAGARESTAPGVKAGA